MSKMIDIKVKDQFSQVTEAKAMLRSFAEHNIHHAAELVKKLNILWWMVKRFCRVLSYYLKAKNLQIFIALSNNLISELQIGRKN